MTSAPLSAPGLDRLIGLGKDVPMIERAFPGGVALGMPPPSRLAINNGNVGADMLAFEEGHPHMARFLMRFVACGRFHHAAANAHALEVVDWFGKHGEGRWLHAMGTGVESLAQ